MSTTTTTNRTSHTTTTTSPTPARAPAAGTGDLAASRPHGSTGYAEPAHRGPRAQEDRPVWLEDFLHWCRAQGIARSTYVKRRRLVSAFIADNPTPFALSDDDVEGWFDRLGINHASRSSYRTHLRALFAWAQQTGLDPSATLARRGGPGTARSVTAYGSGRLLLEVSSPWREPIAAWVAWMQAAARSDETVYLRESQLRRMAADHPGRAPFTVTTDDLTHWLNGQRWSAETLRSNVAAFRSFYGWAHATGRSTVNPAAFLARVSEPHRVPRPTPEHVIADVLTRADDRVRLMILLAAQLGLRRAEIAQLHTDDVRQGLDGLHVLVHGKGNKERAVPVVGDLARLLDDPQREPGYFFPSSNGAHLSPRYVGKLISEALGPGWTAHTLRHRFATVAYSAARDVYAVQSLLGHTSAETTRRYVQLPAASLREAVAVAAGRPPTM